MKILSNEIMCQAVLVLTVMPSRFVAKQLNDTPSYTAKFVA